MSSGFWSIRSTQMTREIELASSRVRSAARYETENQRAWLIALLERLSAGVLGFDQDGRLRTRTTPPKPFSASAAAHYLGRILAELERSSSRSSRHSPIRSRGTARRSARMARRVVVERAMADAC